jgi:hypothetical protein
MAGLRNGMSAERRLALREGPARRKLDVPMEYVGEQPAQLQRAWTVRQSNRRSWLGLRGRVPAAASACTPKDARALGESA